MNDGVGRPAEILLVEDNPADVGLLKVAFKEGKIVNRLHLEETADLALERLKRGDVPDLILLDLDLPGMDGADFLAEIKKDPVLRKVPVAVLTGNVSEADIGRSFDLEAAAYLTKPVSVKKLLRLLDEVDILEMAFVVRDG